MLIIEHSSRFLSLLRKIKNKADQDRVKKQIRGVAPEAHVAREKVLEARITGALRAGIPFEFNGTVYVPTTGVKLK